MPDRRPKLLQDVLDAADAINQFVEGRSFRDYEQNLMLRSAVERQFEIVGEALRRLSTADQSFASRITHVATVISFRNIIAHGYDSLDSRIVWGVIEEDLPVLRQEARALLEELSQSDGGQRNHGK